MIVKMAYDKNKREILEQIILDELRGELLSNEFREDLSELRVGGKTLPLRFELMPEDILYRLCTQKGIKFEDFSLLFEWFAKKNKIYVISKKLGVDIEFLDKMPHKKIMRLFEDQVKNSKLFSYKFSGREIFFLNYSEQISIKPYYGKIKIKKIAQKGRGFDEDDSKDSLYRIAMHKNDHQY